MTKSATYIVTEAPGHHGDRLTVFSSHRSAGAARKAATAGYAAYAANLPYRKGDTLVVHSMDRLARNLEDLRRLVRELTGRGVKVEFVKEGLTFTGDDSPMNTLLLSMLGAVAEFERSMIRERQREGIELAKAKGVYTGRKPALSAEQTAASSVSRATVVLSKSRGSRDMMLSAPTTWPCTSRTGTPAYDRKPQN